MNIRPSTAIRQNYNEDDGMRGSKGYSVNEAAAMMRSAIKKAAGRGKSE